MPFALGALFAVVGCIAALAYAINAWQVYGFARHVWALPIVLSLGAAGVADALSLAGLFATYLLRAAEWGVRAYAWAVFLVMTGLSIAAAESFAAWRRMTPAQQAAGEGYGAQVAAGAIVVALALAVHLLIVCRRHVPIYIQDLPPQPAPPQKTGRPAKTGEPPPPPASEPPPAKKPPAGSGRRGTGRGAVDRRDEFARRVIDGERPADLAIEAGRSKRAIEMWAQEYRKRNGLTLGEFQPDPASDQYVNGAAPEVEVGT